jgi:ribosomal protein L24
MKKGDEVKLTSTGTKIGKKGKLLKVEAKVKPTSIEIKIK